MEDTSTVAGGHAKTLCQSHVPASGTLAALPLGKQAYPKGAAPSQKHWTRS